VILICTEYMSRACKFPAGGVESQLGMCMHAQQHSVQPQALVLCWRHKRWWVIGEGWVVGKDGWWARMGDGQGWARMGKDGWWARVGGGQGWVMGKDGWWARMDVGGGQGWVLGKDG
jgi:hypothetical protein